MGASKVSASRRHRRPGSQLSHPPPRVRKSAGLARSSGSRRPAGPEAWRSDFSPRPRSHPQEAIFNKSTGKVVLKTFSLYRKLLTLCRAGHDQVVVLLSDIRDVNVEEEKVRYFGKGYVVVLRFATGFSHPLTQSAVMGHHSDVEAIAKLITTFLELHCLESPVELSQSSDSEVDGPEDQS
ncbi:cytochrome b-245 chaperone 1 isoform X3 [Kogia breviceps]|uniref:cytochrome b-245 chaperone 1 isoform X3 n=1 Tax=Kogia breviceps TaxID=27615 RepID=UPI0034D22ACA